MFTGIALPSGLIAAKYFFLDLPPEAEDFHARVEMHIEDPTTQPSMSTYTIKVKNTGWRMAFERLSRVEISFGTNIEEISPEYIPDDSTFTPGKIGRIPSGDTAVVCLQKRKCTIAWGGLGPRDVFEISFRVPGPLAAFPQARYGARKIVNWSCTSLDPLRHPPCGTNELSPEQAHPHHGRTVTPPIKADHP